MHLRIVSRYFGLSLLLVSIIILTWSLRAIKYQSLTVDVSAADLTPSGNAKSLSGANAIAGRLKLEWPGWLRLGDAGEIRLTFSPETSNTSGEVVDRILCSRLDLAGIARTPTGEISQALLFDHPITFLWNLRAFHIGRFIGDAWLYVQLASTGESEGDRKVVAAQQFEIPVVDLLGMSGLQARILGGVGFVVGACLGLGDWVSQIIKSLMHRQPVKG